ncbi:MAG: histidine triad nucleotide-binding protein [bacterium]|nr:histidine triad nucleotide-binding protein [bacterium]MDZ4231757.1 histidine triad nucleotide-binding protein [Candidatus Pacearchaeota archaeon]
MDCLFCNIATKKVSSEIVTEDEDFLAFRDIYPKARIHLLVIPKRHIESLKDIGGRDSDLIGRLMLKVAEIAREQGLEGYKVGINVGKKGGQEVDHLHIHLLGNA